MIDLEVSLAFIYTGLNNFYSCSLTCPSGQVTEYSHGPLNIKIDHVENEIVILTTGNVAFINQIKASIPNDKAFYADMEMGIDYDPVYNKYIVFDPTHFKPTHNSYPIQSLDNLTLVNGHRIWLKLIDKNSDNPYIPNLDFHYVQKAGEFLGILPGLPRITTYDDVLKFWQFSSSTYNIKDWQLNKFQNRIQVFGLHAAGRVAEADFGSNHYDHVASALICAIRHQSLSAFDVATLQAHRHLQTLVFNDPNKTTFCRQVYEKCTKDYSGDGPPPVYSHEWPSGTLIWSKITGSKLGIKFGEDLATVLCNRPANAEWNGGGGSRLIGWPMRALLCLYHFDYGNKDLLKTAMVNRVKHLLFIKNKYNTQWLPNVYGTGKTWKPWMDSIALTPAIDICDLFPSVLSSEKQQLLDIAAWEINNVVDAYGNIPYEVIDFSLNNLVYQYGPEMAGWMLPLAWRLKRNRPEFNSKYLALRSKAESGLVAPPFSSYGSAAPKAVSGFLWGLEDRYYT